MAATATGELDPDAPDDFEHGERCTLSTAGVTKDWWETWTFPDKELRAKQDTLRHLMWHQADTTSQWSQLSLHNESRLP